jgi:hypothetical protein
MQLRSYDVRMLPNHVTELKSLARKRSYERGEEWTWCDLVRESVSMILQTQGSEPAVATNSEVKR